MQRYLPLLVFAAVLGVGGLVLGYALPRPTATTRPGVTAPAPAIRVVGVDMTPDGTTVRWHTTPETVVRVVAEVRGAQGALLARYVIDGVQVNQAGDTSYQWGVDPHLAARSLDITATRSDGASAALHILLPS